MHMRIGEVCLHTDNVIRLADFYRQLLGLGGAGDDPVHQMLITGETQFSICSGGTPRIGGQNISLAFTVEDVYAMHGKLIAMGAEIIEGPMKRPWGTVNMSFRDPDGNTIYLRQFIE